ncbi:hypothetical protein H6G89_30460 [Oscillatoria sp. FACHB-1407]|uniref:hypothetical protein n=1 Tax=Oscillatoria sp. FACHB-1407 TaxID=2692847 RepID=UPI0016868706|nr:hypothetical protein [Oscillatoria sp. FACHB-1407]MBD2465337.1 hypothetical protein [Oscillatoria sp. FACHB-1407]
MTQVRPPSPLFRFTCKILKYYLLIVFGFTIACLISSLMGAEAVAIALLPVAGQVFLRIAGLLICLLFITVVFESLRS